MNPAYGPPPLITPRYQLLDMIGEGSMGAVYRANDRLSGQTVALKRVSLAPDADADDALAMRLALAHEFRTLAGLRHPHIISVLDYGFDADRQPFFTMKLLDGAQSLLEFGRGLPLAGQVDLLTQALEALAYLHRRGILHHDLKPANILVAAGQVRLLDFGLAVLAGQERANDAFGTLRYMAPEVLSGWPYTAAADLYSLGVIAYELLVGQHPYPAESLTAFLDQIFSGAPDLTPLAAQPALSAAIGRLLDQRPNGRPSSARASIEMLGRAIGWRAAPDAHAIRESYLQAATFVGRVDERAQLRAALNRAGAGAGSLWLIGGESGVGKSRLLDELRTEALVSGALVAVGQAVEGGGLPYQLWREPARRLVLGAELSDLEAGILKAVVPDIGRLIERAVPDVAELAGEAGQQRLVLTMIDLIRRQRQPVVLILEDLQWAGESMQILRQLSRHAHQLPQLILGSYRDDERPGLPGELPGMAVLPLQRLPEAEIAALSRSMLGEAGARAPVLSLLQHETEGNVFFLVEVVRALAEASGSLEQIGAMTLPGQVFAGGVQRLARRRLDQVPAWGQPLLQIAAVLGRQIDMPVLAVLAGGNDKKCGGRGLGGHEARRAYGRSQGSPPQAPPIHTPRPHILTPDTSDRSLRTAEGPTPHAPTLEAWLAACADAAVLTVAGERWQFAHDKLREALLADVGATERPALHRAAAEAIEQVHAADPAYAETLADHWYYAGATGPMLEATMLAAARLIDVVAEYDRAEALVARALALPGVEATANYPQLIWQLGETYERRARFAEAAEQFQRCLRVIGAAQPQLQIQVLNGLCKISGKQGDFPAAEASARRALQISAAVDDRAGMAIILNSLGIILYRQGQLDQSRQYIERSLALSQALDYQAGVGHCLLNLGNIALNEERYAEAAAYYTEALAVSRAMGNRLASTGAITNLGVVASQQGRYAEAVAYYEESLSLDRSIGAPEGVLSDLIGLGMAYTGLGRPAQARPYVREALEIALAIDVPPYMLEVLACAAQLRLLAGDAPGAAALVGLVADHPATLDWTKAKHLPPLLAELEAALGAAALVEAKARGVALGLEALAHTVRAELAGT